MAPGLPISEQIKSFRRRLNENQGTFGARFGVTALTVGNWERGVFEPSSRHLSRVTAAMTQPQSTAERVGIPYQLELPFDQPIELELRITARSADTVRCEVRVISRAS